MSWLTDNGGIPTTNRYGDPSALPLLPQGYAWIEVTAHNSPEREWIIAKVISDLVNEQTGDHRPPHDLSPSG